MLLTAFCQECSIPSSAVEKRCAQADLLSRSSYGEGFAFRLAPPGWPANRQKQAAQEQKIRKHIKNPSLLPATLYLALYLSYGLLLREAGRWTFART